MRLHINEDEGLYINFDFNNEVFEICEICEIKGKERKFVVVAKEPLCILTPQLKTKGQAWKVLNSLLDTIKTQQAAYGDAGCIRMIGVIKRAKYYVGKKEVASNEIQGYSIY